MSMEPRAGVLRLAPYQQGQSEIEGVSEPIKLSSNESSHGPSRAALAAYRDAASQLHRYPDGSQRSLCNAIAEVHDLKQELIICGNGSDELIQLMVRSYIGEGHESLQSENGFVMSRIHSIAQGADVVIAPEKNHRIDVDAMLSRVSDRTRFCTVANPNNPTGTYLTEDQIRRLHAGLPDNCLFLIDEAYAEYAMAPDYTTALAMVEEHDNVVVTRTFSKIYALSALRIGWAYCPAAIYDVVQRIRTPFNTNGPALAAAEAAIRDTDYIAGIASHNALWRDRIADELTAMGIEAIPSQANFYLMRFPDDSNKSGTGAAAFLQSRGIIPRPAGNGDQFLRVTIGLDAENEAVLSALRDYMAANEQ